MASISLLLKDNNAKGKTRIIAKITDGRKFQMRLSTGYSVLAKHWSKKNKSVLSADNNSAAINRGIKEFTNRALDIYNQSAEEGVIPDNDYFKSRLVATEKAVSANTDFWNVFDYYLHENKTNFSNSTVKKFKSLKNHLLGFETFRKIPLSFDTITTKVLMQLQSYFYEEVVVSTDEHGKPTRKGLNTQTTAKYLGTVKMFLNWAYLNKYNSNLEYKEFKIKQQPKTIKAVLSDADIQKLRDFVTEEKNYLLNVRDLLLLSCFTGLRFSDYSRLKPEHLQKDSEGNFSLLLMQKKTNDYVEVPLNDEVVTIVNKLFNGEVHPISNQNMNVYAKELCKLSGINEPFEVTEYRGNIKVNKTTPKHELISSHSGRRTFATNLLLKGVPAEIVMEFTGHRSYESFSKYVNIPKKAKMDILRKVISL
jgi:site-specific recombinase XerD